MSSYFLKLKNILSKIYLLLTPHREHSKVFENIPIIGFKKEITQRTPWLEPKCLQLKQRTVSMVLAINQDVKFVNISSKQITLNHHLRSAYIP